MLLILLGKTCSGKDAIAKELVMKHGFYRIATTTSRPMRKGEKQDVDYHFVTEDEFKEKINDGCFIEYKTYDTTSGKWYYGTTYESLNNIDDNGKYVIILTPDGYKELVEKLSIYHKSIYVYANNSTIVNRLKKRKDKNDSIRRRLEHDNEDFKGVETIVDKIVYNNDKDNLDYVIEKIIMCMEDNFG